MEENCSIIFSGTVQVHIFPEMTVAADNGNEESILRQQVFGISGYNGDSGTDGNESQCGDEVPDRHRMCAVMGIFLYQLEILRIGAEQFICERNQNGLVRKITQLDLRA